MPCLPTLLERIRKGGARPRLSKIAQISGFAFRQAGRHLTIDAITMKSEAQLAAAFAPWVGRRVALRICTPDVETSLRCTVVSETRATVRIRLADQWDVDIYKEMVSAVTALPTVP